MNRHVRDFCSWKLPGGTSVDEDASEFLTRKWTKGNAIGYFDTAFLFAKFCFNLLQNWDGFKSTTYFPWNVTTYQGVVPDPDGESVATQSREDMIGVIIWHKNQLETLRKRILASEGAVPEYELFVEPEVHQRYGDLENYSGVHIKWENPLWEKTGKVTHCECR